MGDLGVVELVLGVVLTAAFWVGVPVAIFVFARRFLRAVERRSVRESQIAELTERLQRLEEHLYDLADENERLREDQRFTRELLLERSPEARRSPPGAA
jgi:cell division protein FtsB